MHSLAIGRDGLGFVASLHEHRQQHHTPVLGSNMQGGDAVAAPLGVRLGMTGAQQSVDYLCVASSHRMVQHCVACMHNI